MVKNNIVEYLIIFELCCRSVFLRVVARWLKNLITSDDSGFQELCVIIAIEFTNIYMWRTFYLKFYLIF